MKICNKCNENKKDDEFRIYQSKGKTYIRNVCKKCLIIQRKEWRKNNPEVWNKQNSRHSLKRRYNLSENDFIKLKIKQNNKCGICQNEETAFDPRWKKTRNLSVDHDHKTGKVRGLLCTRCNTAIGLLKEDVNLFQQSINYLNGVKQITK